MTLCVNAGNVYTARIDNNINIVVYNYDPYQGLKFKEKFQYSHTLGLKTNGNVWYHMANIGNHVTNLNTVFLFVLSISGKLTIYECSEHRGPPKIVEWVSYDFEPSTSVQNVSFANGPSILRLGSTNVRLLLPLYDIDRTYPLNLEKSVLADKILFFECIDRKLNSDGFSVLFLLIISTVHTISKASVQTYVLQSEWYNKKSEDFLRPVCNDFFFPQKYQSSITSIRIVFDNVDFFSKQFCYPWCKNHTILCTSTELLSFYKGELRHCCEIPFQDIKRIVTLPHETSNLENYIALQSASNGVCCCVVKPETKKLECVQSWPGAQHVFLGDFSKNSSKQLLLLYDNSFEYWQDGCSLIDFQSLSQNLTSEDEEIPVEHLTKITTGLNKRLMSARASIAKSKCDISRKNAHIHNLYLKIRQHTTCKASPSDNDSSCSNALIDIISSNDDFQISCKKGHSETEHLAIEVKESWKTFLMNQLMFGWSVQNTSKNSVTNLQVTAVPANRKMEYTQKVYNHDWRTLFSPAPERGHIDPQEVWSIVIALPMPLLITDSIDIPFIISWSMGKDYKSQLYFGGEELFPCQQMLLQSTITVSDLLQMKQRAGCTEIQQLMSYRAIQERVLLCVSVKEDNLGLKSFLEAITKDSSLPSPTLKQHKEQNYFIFEESESPLHGVNASIYHQEETKMEIDVYVRNVKEGVLFVQWLYAKLPEEIDISPKELSKKEVPALRRKLLLAIKDEIDIIRTLFPEDGKKESEAMELDCEEVKPELKEKISLTKETFSRIRCALTKREFVTDLLMSQLTLNEENN